MQVVELERDILDAGVRLDPVDTLAHLPPEPFRILVGPAAHFLETRRVDVGVRDIPRVRYGLGLAVLSTPRGVLSDRLAREQNVGGELMCEVW